MVRIIDGFRVTHYPSLSTIQPYNIATIYPLLPSPLPPSGLLLPGCFASRRTRRLTFFFVFNYINNLNSYWTRGDIYGYPTKYGYHHKNSAVEIFKDLLDDVNVEFLTAASRDRQQQRVGMQVSGGTRACIGTVTFGQNCIVVTKKTEEEHRLYDQREYRYKKKL